MNPVLLIPIYNHGEPFKQLIRDLCDFDLPGIIVDDGSDRKTKEILDDIEDKLEGYDLLRLEENTGKGKALKTGLEYAEEEGYSHAIQIDADYQHDPSDIPKFLSLARSSPDALILGTPCYDDSVPFSRYYGRKLSRVWVWIETLSTTITDPLIGYRCYPIERTVKLIRNAYIGNRMEFEPEIAVRFFWDGGPIETIETPISYDPDNASHFHMFYDNLRISCMHCRLFFGMLFRSPFLLKDRLTASS